MKHVGKQRLLVVEDEAGLLLTLVDRLCAEGFEVETATEGYRAERMALSGNHDLIVLDLMLPGQSGLAVCERLRCKGLRTPILMLTAMGSVDDRVTGLRLGADDYLTKPFAMQELLARIEALLRRVPQPERSVTVGEACVDLDATRVMRDGEPVEVSARLFQLLAYMIDHAGQTVTRDQLLNEVWGHKSLPATRTVDVHMASLRRIVEADPKSPTHLVTVHGIGYRLDL